MVRRRDLEHLSEFLTIRRRTYAAATNLEHHFRPEEAPHTDRCRVPSRTITASPELRGTVRRPRSCSGGSRVIAADACPSMRWTALIDAPLLIARLAAVSRRSCGTRSGFPIATAAGAKTRFRNTFSRSGPPCNAVKTRSSRSCREEDGDVAVHGVLFSKELIRVGLVCSLEAKRCL